MAIITLISDWGCGNHYAGAVKGTLLRLIPGAVIVDISHDVASYNILQAYFILKNAYPQFPESTIHLVGILTEAGIDSPHIVVRCRGQYFIGADNGIFSLLFGDQFDEAVEIDIHQDSDYFTFASRDVFARVASLIVSGKSLGEIGNPYKVLNQKIPFKPVVYPDKIIGKVIFIDTYQNVFVNIDQALFKQVANNRPFVIQFRSPGNAIHKIHQSYDDVPAGERLAVFGSTSYLEIAINQGKASSLLGLHIDDTVSVEFHSPE